MIKNSGEYSTMGEEVKGNLIMDIVLGFLRGLKLPVRLLSGWLRKRRKFKDEWKAKQRKHVRNFDPTRLKNVSYQVRMGKKLSKKQKEWKKRKKKKKFSKKTNNFSEDRNY